MYVSSVLLVPMLAKAMRVVAEPVLALGRIMYTKSAAHFCWTSQA